MSSIEILWIILLLLSVFFSGMEVAFVASDKMRHAVTKKTSGFYNHMLNTLYSRSHQFLTTLTIGNLLTLVFFVYLTITVVENYYSMRYILPNDFVRYLLIIIFVSIVLLITNEFIPRLLFRRNPNVYVRIFALPAFLFYILLYPVARLSEGISKVILKMSGIHLHESKEKTFDRKDLDSYIKQSIEEMTDEKEVESEVKIFRNALDFYTMKLRDCMVPRTEIVAVSEDASLEVLKEKFVETGLSRILVYRNNIDNIIGYIHIWEIFTNSEDWTKKIAATPIVPESMQAIELMRDLMQQRKGIAVVVDEFGGTSGLVTMEDLVEEIFGEIEDEYDTKTKFMKRESDTEFVLSGRVEIDHLNETYGLEIPESDDYSTIAGYLLYHTQRFPKTYETIVTDDYTFKILKVTERKIEVVRLTID
ncbi:MAG: hemolysin family protein [Dysgonamonadaceae bacterium]|nr:hemolysin family protein [Dysgonamonadaceae bacterium]